MIGGPSSEDDVDPVSAALAGGSVEGFGRFYDATAPGLLRYFYRRTTDAESASELLAETYAQALESRGRFDPRLGNADQWLYGVARNVLRRWFRTQHQQLDAAVRLRLRHVPADPSTVAALEQLEPPLAFDADLEEAWRHLSDEQIDAVTLRVLEDRSYEEIATQLGISEQAARARVARGLHTLRERLGS